MKDGPSRHWLRIIGAACACAGRAACFVPAWLGLAAVAWTTGASAADAPSAVAETAPPEPGALHYEFGRGLKLGDTGFTLGGYVTGEYKHLDGEASRLRSSHASAFVWWEGMDRVKLFAEVDLLDGVSGNQNDYDEHSGGRRVSLERLYGDYTFSDALALRLGKFLTPVGRWNQVHADPLVWTTTAPMVAQTFFPRSVTGASLGGNVPAWGRAVGYSVYLSNGREWRADSQEDPFAKVLGGRLVLPLGSDLQLGISAANYQLRSRNGEPQQLRGVDLYWSRGGIEFSAEWLLTRGTAVAGQEIDPDRDHDTGPSPINPVPNPYEHGGPRSTRGGYVQGVLPLGRHLFAVARTDWLHDPRTITFVRQHLVGVTWRPNAGTSVKLEYVRPSQAQPPTTTQGIVASVCVLF